jgi:hypothetical protein
MEPIPRASNYYNSRSASQQYSDEDELDYLMNQNSRRSSSRSSSSSSNGKSRDSNKNKHRRVLVEEAVLIHEGIDASYLFDEEIGYPPKLLSPTN